MQSIPIAVAVEHDLVPICPTCKIIPRAKTGDRFCAICGDALHTQRVRIVHCSCDETRELLDVYCPVCGTSVEVLAQRYDAEQIRKADKPATPIIGAPR